MQKEMIQNSQRGFTVIELSIVLLVSGLLLIPLLKLAFTAVGGNRDQQTDAALEEAVDALITYADVNNGCLPFAADFEGGLPDVDEAGAPLTDNGIGKNNQHAGDLPWAELGLVNNFRDGDFLRVQYYVATPYAGANCSAGYRGQEWNPQVTYIGTVPNPIYVYVTVNPSPSNPPSLYKITSSLAAGTHPGTPGPGTPEDVTAALPNDLLTVKRGPDITSNDNNQKDVLSAQNVFVLIATGENRNPTLDRRHMRDAGHLASANGSGTPWALGFDDVADGVNNVVFSMVHDLSSADRQDDGDDTLRVMSFIEYKSRLKAFGKSIQPICDNSC